MIYSYALAVVRDREPIIASLAAPVESIAIARWAVDQAGTALLHIGNGDRGRTITQEGQVWEFDPPWTDGIFITTNGAGVGSMDVDLSIRLGQAPPPVSPSRPRNQNAGFMRQLLKNFGVK